MKRLYLMRHAHAPTAREAGVAQDGLRPISTLGREDARRMAALLAGRGGAPALILHSPLLRAAQTAGEAAAVLKPASGIEPFDALDNTRSAEEVSCLIAERAASFDEVLAIGHQPQIGDLASLIGKNIFDMSPASIVALEVSPTPRVLWALSPERAK
jgi:phosphohistidine phosphatase